MGQHRRQLAQGALALSAAAFFAVIPPRLVGAIFDELGRPSAFAAVGALAVGIVAATVVESLLRVIGRYSVLNVSREVEYTMRNDLFAHLQRMHLAYFQHQRTGDIMARMINDLGAVRQMMGFGVQAVVMTAVIFVFSLVSMLAVSVHLTLIALVIMPLVSLAFWSIGRRVHVLFERLQEQFAELSTRAQENFSGIRVVKAFSQEEPEIARFARATDEYAARAVQLARVDGLIWPAMSFLIGLAVLSALWVGGQDAIRGDLTLGQLVQFVAYLQLLSMPMIMLGEVTNLIQQGWASLRRLQELYDAVPEIAEPADPVAGPIRGEVEFRGVTFAYGPTVVLRDVSFRVPAGSSLAIVGHTGAGKSSLVNLIPRLFDAQQGEVLLDGVSVRRFPLEMLRRAIGYVPQETFLFSVPLRENVGFGAERALTPSQLEWAGDVSQLNKDVADFPAKYETMIGERGVTLSGGQKQRAAIARAVAKDPRVLILDDALSAVDTYTEAEILRRLRGVMSERTSIIVAHRISTVKDADLILVLDDGRIAERGDHRTLLEQGGLYARMYRRQLVEEELQVDEEQVEHERRVRSEDPALAVEPPRLGGRRAGLSEDGQP